MNCDRVGMPDVGYPENPTVTTVIESLKRCNEKADYFRKYREDRAEIKKRDDMIADLKSQIEALKNNAYRVGYNDGRDSEIESRRWDDYVGM